MHKEKLLKFLATFFAINGFITGITSFFDKSAVIVAIAASMLLISGVAMGIYYFRELEGFSPKDLIPDISEKSEVRTVKYKDELQVVANLDKETYGEHSVDFNGLLEWWTRYQDGVYILVYKRMIIGAVGIWPLTESTFEKLVNGRLKESDLRGDDICEKVFKHRYWYFGDIILDKKYRDKHLSPILIKSASDAWLQQRDRLADEVHMSAIGATHSGRHLLSNLEFHNVTKAPDGLPVYEHIATIVELQEDIKHQKWMSK